MPGGRGIPSGICLGCLGDAWETNSPEFVEVTYGGCIQRR